VIRKLILATSVLALMAVSIANAQPRGGMMMATDELGLSKDQQNRFDEMRLQHQKDMIKKNADLKVARLELRDMMRTAKVDEKAALAKQDAISKMKADIAAAKLKHMLAMRNVLNADQLEKWMNMHHDRGMFKGKGMKHHRGDRMGCDRPCMGPGMMGGPGMGMGMGPGPGGDDDD
jgi:Spy/CpxP family protein refolding chaperone